MPRLNLAVEHDFLQPRHFLRAEGERAVGAHLHAGPAIVVVRGGHHGDARHVELELREIGHRRDAEADVVHLAARRHQAGDQRHLHRGRIGAEVVAGDDLRLDAHLLDERAEAQAQRLDPHQVDFFFQQPARVVFAKARRLHQRRGFIGIGVRASAQASGWETSRPQNGFGGAINSLTHKGGKAVQNRANDFGYCSSTMRPLAYFVALEARQEGHAEQVLATAPRPAAQALDVADGDVANRSGRDWPAPP